MKSESKTFDASANYRSIVPRALRGQYNCRTANVASALAWYCLICYV